MSEHAVPELVLAIVNIDPAIADDVYAQILDSGASSAVIAITGVRTVYKNRGLRDAERAVLLVLTTAERFADLTTSVQAAGGDAPFMAIGMPVFEGEDATWSWAVENLTPGGAD